MKKRLAIFFLSLGLIFFAAGEIWWFESAAPVGTKITIRSGEDVGDVAPRLEASRIIRRAWLFRYYMSFSGRDNKIQVGSYEFAGPLTAARVAKILLAGPKIAERTVTIIPGWNLRDVAAYFEREGWGKAADVFAMVGAPAKIDTALATTTSQFRRQYLILGGKPAGVSLEGYLAPNTYRVFPDASLDQIIGKMLAEREREFQDIFSTSTRPSTRTTHEILTMASIIEREVRHDADRAKVADILWRRHDRGWPLQVDSAVHYMSGRAGDLFTTKAERQSNNPWNTYRHRGLPPGPISNPGRSSISAALRPEPNAYWYFLTTPSGEVKYGRDFDEHQRNIVKYLR